MGRHYHYLRVMPHDEVVCGLKGWGGKCERLNQVLPNGHIIGSCKECRVYKEERKK